MIPDGNWARNFDLFLALRLSSESAPEKPRSKVLRSCAVRLEERRCGWSRLLDQFRGIVGIQWRRAGPISADTGHGRVVHPRRAWLQRCNNRQPRYWYVNPREAGVLRHIVDVRVRVHYQFIDQHRIYKHGKYLSPLTHSRLSNFSLF